MNVRVKVQGNRSRRQNERRESEVDEGGINTVHLSAKAESTWDLHFT